MKNFTLYQPKTAESAVGLLDKAWGKTELLAGGTDLLDLQKEYVAQPDKVVSLGAVRALDGIRLTKRLPPLITIGAGVKLAALASDPTIKNHATALADAAG